MTTQSPLADPTAWNIVAEGYEQEFLPLFSLYSGDAIALADLPEHAEVLDVAAGPGTLSLLVADRAKRVVAVDFADTMVDILKRRARDAGLDQVQAQVGDGQALPFGDSSFDAAFSMFGLMFFPDRKAGFQELLRVLRPGRKAVVSGWAPVAEVPLIAALFEGIAELLPGLPLGRTKAPLSDAAEFASEMSAAGFRNVEVHTVKHRVELESVQVFWASQTRASAPIALIRSRMSEAEWNNFSEAMIKRLTAQFGEGPIEFAWPALLGVGKR